MSVILIQLPSLSPTMELGTITEWKVKEGDLIEGGRVIASIATDKSTVDYESLDEGYLRKIVMSEGSEGPVGQIIAILTEDADEEYEAEQKKKLGNLYVSPEERKAWQKANAGKTAEDFMKEFKTETNQKKLDETFDKVFNKPKATS